MPILQKRKSPTESPLPKLIKPGSDSQELKPLLLYSWACAFMPPHGAPGKIKEFHSLLHRSGTYLMDHLFFSTDSRGGLGDRGTL